MRDFPQEIIEQIIDCSVRQWTDNDARKICGLVCRAWLHRTRCHLFSTVTLIPGTLRTFVDIIGTSFLPILPLIRHLRLHYIGQSFDVTLLQQVHCCPNLASIRIAILDPGPSFGSWGDWLDSSEVHLHLRSWSANAVSLSRFEIGFGGYRFTVPVSTITFLLSCFPSLDTAVIYDYFRFGTFEDECAPATPPHLAHLELSGWENTDMFFSWLISLPVLPNLKTIKFKSDPPMPGSKFEALEAYVRRAGGELESLTIQTSGLWEG
ncbi:hypothetical protein B0H11DRAFT_2247179 [Mycena galericulata]|nr:hypothetical protein B0H11DRAFT_2247179 [Mycena galericulata]